MIFRGPRHPLGHFGQEVPESPVSQLQNGVSTSSLPPFSVDLLIFKLYPRSNSFFQWELLRVLNCWFQYIRKIKYPFYACKQMIMSLKCHLRTAPKENKSIWGVVAVALSWTFILGKGSKNKNGNFSLRSYSNQYKYKNCGRRRIDS